MVKLKWVVRAAGMVLMLGGFLLAIGTAGSSDCGMIGVNEVLIREAAAAVMVVVGLFAADEV